MKREQLNLLAIIAAILVLIPIIFFILTNNSNMLDSSNFFNNDISTVNRITIQRNEEHIELTKDNSNWLVNNYAANNEDVINFLKNIDEASIIATVATNETSYATFQVDSDSASNIKLYNNDNLLLEAFVGKTTGYSMYVRLANDSKVYEINKNFSGILNKTKSELRSTIITDVNIENM
jgi:hypothetical protein